MNNFIHKHWCGEYSLPRAYWVNGVLIDCLALIIAGVAGAGLEDLGEDRESILVLIYFLGIVLNVWQTVGKGLCTRIRWLYMLWRVCQLC